MDAPYEVTTDQDSIVIRLPRDFADAEALAQFLDLLDMQAIRQKSQLSDAEAAQLATEVKQDAWARVRHLFEIPAEE